MQAKSALKKSDPFKGFKTFKCFRCGTISMGRKLPTSSGAKTVKIADTALAL